jgi:signal transduction histidine kinase/CheY-like chemotaxis protein/HAMP domain-containing protein
LPNAFEGNYAFIWDYQCRSIVHPRHHSLVGYDANSGDEQIPWLESSIYEELLARVGGTGVADLQAAWPDLINQESVAASNYPSVDALIKDVPVFNEQSRTNKPAAALTGAGFVGLDGRYLNTAPQCTGWMDLTRDGGSGSFYILWSGLYKLTTAAAIPYYTGQYAPSEENGYSRRGFAMLTVGAGLESFQEPVTELSAQMESITQQSIRDTALTLTLSTAVLVALVIAIAIWLANNLTNSIQVLINGITRFRSGDRNFRFNTRQTDEFGHLANSFDSMADSIVNSVSSPLCILDNNMLIRYANAAAEELIKKSSEELAGEYYYDNSLFPKDTIYDPIKALHEGRQSEVFFSESSGRYYRGVATYFHSEGSPEPGYYVLSTDVTDIQMAREHAEQASVAKTAFLSNMSHEMRTPMNAIIGMTTIGRGTADLAKKDYCFDKITGASSHLLGVINDILDISKIEANKFELSMVEADFEKILQRVINVTSYRIDEKSQEFLLALDPAIPHSIIIDDQRLAQVITNLLSNANKFTPEGGTIRLGTKLISDDGDTVTIKIEVSDTGIGISEDQKDRIFTEFEQAENSTTRAYGGTGLGLAISKRIIRMMGGDIWVESEPNEGSTFAFTFVATRGTREPGELLLPHIDREHARLLVVDDEPEILEFFDQITSQLGLHCDTAANGHEALDLIDRGKRYDIYFVDWRMPGMDGIELSQMIRSRIEEDAVVIMISATEWSAIEDKARKAGVDMYLPKPLFPSALADCINQCIGAEQAVASARELAQATGAGGAAGVGGVGGSGAAGGAVGADWAGDTGAGAGGADWAGDTGAGTGGAAGGSGAAGGRGGRVASGSAGAAAAEPVYTGKRVMLVEDVEVNREIAIALLEPTEVEVVSAVNGKEAVDLFVANPSGYDLIFMDIQMPVMDGYEATRQIRALGTPESRQVPIVAMTANVFREDIEKSLEAGMNDHIGKPINFAEVLDRMAKYLGRRR